MQPADSCTYCLPVLFQHSGLRMLHMHACQLLPCEFTCLHPHHAPCRALTWAMGRWMWTPGMLTWAGPTHLAHTWPTPGPAHWPNVPCSYVHAASDSHCDSTEEWPEQGAHMVGGLNGNSGCNVTTPPQNGGTVWTAALNFLKYFCCYITASCLFFTRARWLTSRS